MFVKFLPEISGVFEQPNTPQLLPWLAECRYAKDRDR